MSEIIINRPNFPMVQNAVVYDLKESLIAAGYPMRTTTQDMSSEELAPADIKRGMTLTKATLKGNQAHDQFLSGVRVAFDLRCSNKMWVEAERYRFLSFVSSQSTMHRITKFDLSDQYNEYVDGRIVDIMQELVGEYNEQIANGTPVEELKDLYLQILYSNPAGFELTARMSTNYRCLKNIYTQRKDHRLPEWREFCKWIETLPYAHELILCDA